jgi:protein-S-isoprenylcysteine O-methyltransferase Ste14
MHDSTDASAAGLIRGALEDARQLVRDELALARAELRQELNKATNAGVRFALAAATLWFAGMFVLVALALGLSSWLDWPVWASFGAISIVLAIVGAVFLSMGRQAIRDIKPLPRTVATLKENFR